MDKRNVENGLAIAGALLVLVGVTFAASSALAEEASTVETTAVAIHTAGADSRLAAAETHDAAARDAVRSIALDNELDLDIRFSSHISKHVVAAN